MSAGAAALAAFAGRTGWFAADDFRNLWEAKESGLTLDFLLTPVIDARFEPGHRLVNWIVVQFPGHEWAVAVAVGTVAIAAATLGVILVSRDVTHSYAIAIAVGAVFGTWVGWSRIALWLANSAQTLPAIALMAWTVYCSIRWDRGGRRNRQLVLPVVLLATAFCFSVRSALVLPILATMLVVAEPPSRSISAGRLLQRIRETWLLLGLAAIVAIAFVVIELSTNNALESSLPSPSIGNWVSFGAHWMTEGAGSVVSNRWLPGGANASPAVWAGFLFLLAFAGLTIRGTRSAAVWAAIAVLLLACGVQVATYRLAQLGLLINEDPRYHEGDALLLALLLPAAWVTAGRPYPRNRTQAGAVGALLLAFTTLWITGWASTIHAIKGGGDLLTARPVLMDQRQASIAKASISTLRNSLAREGAEGPGIPPSIISDRTPAAFSPYVGRDLPGIVAVFLPNLRVSFLSPRGVPLSVSDEGVARRVQLRNPHSLVGPRRVCLRTTRKSGLAGPGSTGIAYGLPRGYGTRGPIVVDLPLSNTTAGGSLTIMYMPSSTNLPDVQVAVGEDRPGVRALIPAATLGINVSAFGGLNTCIEDPRVWEVAR